MEQIVVETFWLHPDVIVNVWVFMMWPALLLALLVTIFVLSALRAANAPATTRLYATLVLVITTLVILPTPLMQLAGMLDTPAQTPASLPILSLVGLFALLVNAGSILYFSSSMGGRRLTTEDWKNLGSMLRTAGTTLVGITKTRGSGTSLVDPSKEERSGATVIDDSRTNKFASLRVMLGSEAGTVFDLFKSEETRIGRDPRLNEIVLNDPRVSSQHAKIRSEKGEYVLYDLGSSNGTFVNGLEVSGPRTLANQDKIQVGETVMLFQVAAS